MNNEYFEGALSKPVITIQSTPKAYGHFTLYDAWHTTNENQLKEINIGAGTLDRPIENLVATLLHEMVHYYCFENGFTWKICVFELSKKIQKRRLWDCS